MCRPGDDEKYEDELLTQMNRRTVMSVPELLNQSAGSVLKIDVTRLSISSSNIRQLLLEGKSPRFLLPDPVLEYIGLNSLYRANLPE
jgi:nicotinate-nucleotide adenylyltransferase